MMSYYGNNSLYRNMMYCVFALLQYRKLEMGLRIQFFFQIVSLCSHQFIESDNLMKTYGDYDKFFSYELVYNVFQWY